MSHPHAGDGAQSPSAGQTKTLFFAEPPDPSKRVAAILVTSTLGRMKQRPLRFDSAHAALDWCLENHAGLVMSCLFNPSAN